MPVPVIDQDACTRCGKCGTFCAFNAIAALPTGTVVFPELCHGCGGCYHVCPEFAIDEAPRVIGTLQRGTAASIPFVTGRLNVGEARTTLVIDQVKATAPGDATVLLDCPPGTACPAVAAMHGCDVAVLVAEPTAFGLHDLSLAVATARRLGVVPGVVINRAGIGDDRVRDFCACENVPLLAELPDDRRVAELYARGKPACELDGMRERFEQLWDGVLHLAANAALREAG
jgi:MinD superfamily P-loop ATPase